MKNLIAELLIKMAEKEAESKALIAQIEALEIVTTAIIRHVDPATHHDITQHVHRAMNTPCKSVASAPNTPMLEDYVQKLLAQPRPS
ncbi:anti-adapter protein IraP [Enterobacterales bacterium CwR94]|nr:anti-adapter protein IraP [Enterobacterales bacterium CwR94]